LRCRSRESSLAACDEDQGEAGCPPAAHGGPRWSRDPPVACGRDSETGVKLSLASREGWGEGI